MKWFDGGDSVVVVFREWISRVLCSRFNDERGMSVQEVYIGRDADNFSARACSLSMMLETYPPTGVGECRIFVQRGGNAAVE